MIAVYARCVVTGQHVDEFIELATKLVEETRKEPENISYELVRGREGKNVFAFMEKGLKLLMESKELRVKISMAMCTLVDGNGAGRLAEALINL